MKKLLSKQFLLFLCTGGIAAIVNITSRIAYNQWWDFSTAIILAYITGMITAFILSKYFVFKESKQAIYKSSFYFLIINLLAIVQTWVISILLAYHILPWLGVTLFTKELAHIAGVITPVFSSYLGHKYLSFK